MRVTADNFSTWPANLPRAVAAMLLIAVALAFAMATVSAINQVPSRWAGPPDEYLHSDSCLRSAEVGARLGIDCLLGGTQVADILGLLRGSSTGYFPFPGIPVGHPTKLGGTAQRIADDTRAMVTAGCAGIDLLAYRATDAGPLDLVRAARQATEKTIIVAGSINSPARIRDIAGAGADLFTIGTAALDGSFSPRYGLLANQLRRILAACANSDLRTHDT
jgi:hypothetical protein